MKTLTDNQEGNRRPHDAAGLLAINALNQTKNAGAISGRLDGRRVLRDGTFGATRDKVAIKIVPCGMGTYDAVKTSGAVDGAPGTALSRAGTSRSG